MPTFVLFLFRFARLLFSGHGAVAVENAALRLQLAAFQRKRKRPVLTSFDRLFWVGLSLLWNRWRTSLLYVRADTVVRWQRNRFRRFWARLSRVKHRRREVLHFNVTEHPTAAWTSQQIVEAFGEREAPRYIIRDRDGVYGSEVRLRIASLQIEEVLTAPQSPWQNPYVERLIGSIRRDCLNHFVILNARHLKRTLASYFAYYHGSRTHLGLKKECPSPRSVSSIGKITEIPQLGGLHHRYERFAE